MLKIHLLWPGKTREQWLKQGIAFYLKRIKNYYQVNQIETRACRAKAKEAKRAIEEEAVFLEKALAKLKGTKVVLDMGGKELTSPALASFIKNQEEVGPGAIIFIIGGAFGLSQRIISAAELRLSLSRFTFTHELSRLILLEQIYRAACINSGSPYHH